MISQCCVVYGVCLQFVVYTINCLLNNVALLSSLRQGTGYVPNTCELLISVISNFLSKVQAKCTYTGLCYFNYMLFNLSKMDYLIITTVLDNENTHIY